MGYYISHMLGIRLGGVFSNKTDIEDLKSRINRIIKELRTTENDPDVGDDISHCLSQELIAHKGSYAVIAGVFNYWDWETATVFSKALSKEFGTEVMHACWDEESGERNFEVFLDGKALDDTEEGDIGSILRRCS